uniref:Uncharacterized protein n=1 Tax=Eutreptiella gymnastica TaxID=73025 RepID=A0A7S1NPI2_9EUGL
MPPGMDLGRNREMCSSPREHPLVEARMNVLVAEGKSSTFTKVIGLEEPAAATYEKPTTEHVNLDAIKFEDDHSKLPQLGSPCFMTKFDRFKMSPPTAPPVGHYRPRFAVVDRTAPASLLRGPPEPASPRPPRTYDQSSPHKTPHAGSSKPSAAAEAAPAAAAVHADEPAAPAPEGGAAEDPNGPPKAQLPAAGADSTAESPRPTKHGYVVATPRRQAKPKGTAPFVSRTPQAGDRPADPLRSPDKVYWPYNEVNTSPRPGKGAMVDFDRATISSPKYYNGCAPDVIYDPKAPKALSPGPAFENQIDRTKAQRTATVQVYRQGTSFQVNGMQAYDSANYHVDEAEAKSTKFRNHNPVDFNKKASRDQVPTAMTKSPTAMTKDLGYDVQTPKAHSPTVAFGKQKPREQYMCQLPLDLSYDPKYTLVERTAPTKGMDKSEGHKDFFTTPEHKDVQYNPSDRFSTPRRDFSPNFSAGPENSRPPLKRPQVDKFYDRDSPLAKPRTKGNPMLAQHISRDRRNETLSPKGQAPDKFYDYSAEIALPSPGKSYVEFGKMPPRDTFGTGLAKSPSTKPGHKAVHD